MSRGGESRPPFLLVHGQLHATLAAAQCLGREGVPVVVAESRLLAPARWSRRVARRIEAPSPLEPGRFIDWLLAFGEEEPGHVLYPTSRDVAFLYAQERDSLSRHFRVQLPSTSAVYAVLDRERVYAAAARVGIDTPVTFFPRDLGEIERVAAEVPYPAVVKPRTKLLLESHPRERRVDGPAELAHAYRDVLWEQRHASALLAKHPDAALPMIQAWHPEVSRGIFSVTGFVDAGRERIAARAAVKALYRPRAGATRMCFEDVKLPPDLRDRLLALCRDVGYHGAFEADFVRAGGRPLLIAFRPHFSGNLGFDVARGLPLPLLAYDEALGDRERVAQRLGTARDWSPHQKRGHPRHLGLEVMLAAQRIYGQMSRNGADAWRRWYEHDRLYEIAPTLDEGDWVPQVIDAIHHLYEYARGAREPFEAHAREP